MRPSGGVGRKSFVVRVAGLDAPEAGQAMWRVARNRLREPVAPGTTLGCYKVDRWGRRVCWVHSAEGVDLVARMVRQGLAWHSTRFIEKQTADENGAYFAAEQAARATRAGIWAEQDPQPPWECRQSMGV